MPDSLKDEGCPVTAVQFIESGNENQDFTYVEFTNGHKLGYSKVSNSLPMTDFQVQQNKPCLSSITGSWANDKHEQSYYLNEFNQLKLAANDAIIGLSVWKEGCAVHAESGEYFAKDRYKNIVEGLD